MIGQTLDERVDLILITIKEILEGAKNELYFKSIEIGDRERGADPPWLWVTMDSMVGKQPATGFGIRETWTGNIYLASVINSNDPITGQRESQKLAIRASEVLMRDRSFRNTVDTAWRSLVSPSYQRGGDSESLYSSGVQISISLVHDVDIQGG